MLLGEAHYVANQIELARDEFQAAVNLRPEDPEAHVNLGQCFYRLGQMRAAVIQFRIFLEKDGGRDPRSGDVRRLVAQLEGSQR